MTRNYFRVLLVGVIALMAVFSAAVRVNSVYSAHPIFIEGERDFDGDGRTGAAENTDGNDGIFGTINAALNTAGPAGLGQNGKATIVTSGRFFETVVITGPVTLEAAYGVEADVDGFNPPAGGPQDRRAAPGIVVNAMNNVVNIINIKSRNWTDGIRILNGRVNIINCAVETNIGAPMATTPSWGINVLNGIAVISRTLVTNNRNGGIAFQGGSGTVTDSVVSYHATGTGIVNGGNTTAVTQRANTFAGNATNISGVSSQ